LFVLVGKIEEWSFQDTSIIATDSKARDCVKKVGVTIRTAMLPKMYGPPRECKGKAKGEGQVCANVFGL
jgi:hypothetical protein